METMTIWDGIVVGGAGGAIAGLTVAIVKYLHIKRLDYLHKKRVYLWLKQDTTSKPGNSFRSTRTIASWNNMTEDRTRYVCSIHAQIFLSTGEKEDMWSLYERNERSVYEHRGIRSV